MSEKSWGGAIRGAGSFISDRARRTANKLGVISLKTSEAKDDQVYREAKLETLDSYYEGRQYAKLPKWNEDEKTKGHVPLRSKQPLIKFPFAKTLSKRVTAKLLGHSVFPSFTFEEFPDEQEFFNAIIREAKLRSRLLEPLRRGINSGSVFVRFYISAGVIKLERYDSKFCYPVFQDNGQLESVTVRYIYTDKEDRDANGKPKRKWYQLTLDQNSETLFDNPEYQKDKDPDFQIVEQVEHGFGFVQGSWFRTAEVKDSPDGHGLCEDILEFIDEINYSLSQSNKAVSYNQDPQLIIKNMTEEEMATLIRSSMKSWNMGQKGEATFLESDLTGVERAGDLRNTMKQNIQDISFVTMLDPEKIIGSAQSGKAMEVLHGPFKDLIDDLRPAVEEFLKELVLKIGLAVLMASKKGMDVPLNIPPGWFPQSFEFKIEWPPIFAETMQDMQQKIALAVQATSGNLISRKTGTRFIAKIFGVDDIEAEHAEIAAQPVFNPFGGF